MKMPSNSSRLVMPCPSLWLRIKAVAEYWVALSRFHEIASFMQAADMDPMATYEREESEKPAHEPLADARQSARLLATALRSLANATAQTQQGQARPVNEAKDI